MPLTAANSMPIQTQQVGQSSPAPVDASIFAKKRTKKKDEDHRGTNGVQPDSKPSTAAIFARRK